MLICLKWLIVFIFIELSNEDKWLELNKLFFLII